MLASGVRATVASMDRQRATLLGSIVLARLLVPNPEHRANSVRALRPFVTSDATRPILDAIGDDADMKRGAMRDADAAE